MNTPKFTAGYAHQALIYLVIGLAVGAALVWLSRPDTGTTPDPVAKPLHWVAPMDPNYKRDQPGKSPMGMDLIPVYADKDTEQAPGKVRISPEVVNNLGVRTAAVQRGRLNSSVHTVGYVQYDENRQTQISPRVEGWIEKLYVRAEGDPVSRSEPLYAIYSPVLVNAQQEYLLAHRRKNAALITAATDRLSALQVSESAIRRLRDSGRAARTITVTAPQSGVIDHMRVREGMYVSPGMSLMSVSSLEHLWVIGEVFERESALVETGDPVSLSFDYLPGQKWEGSVQYIYPSLNEKTRTAQVRVHLENPDGALKPGMLAQLHIDTGESNEALLLPREALIRTGKQNRVVLALGDGKFRSVAVEVGRISPMYVEVLAGLRQGDLVVNSAQFLIDSESSKTSDFKRMTQATDTDPVADSVWVQARVEGVMIDHVMVTLAHPAIDAWQWPAMTMDFPATANVDIQSLQVGSTRRVQLSRSGDNDHVLSDVESFDHVDAPADGTKADQEANTQDKATESASDDPADDHSGHAAPPSYKGKEND